MHSTRKKDIIFIATVIIVHLVFFLLAWHYKHIFNRDSPEYIYMAFNIKDHGWFYSGNQALPLLPEFLTLRPPGYSLFLAGIYSIAVNNWLVLVAQNLLSVFNIYYLRNTIKLMGYNSKHDWFLLAFVILFPSQFINANIIAPDILLQTFVLIYFHQFVMLLRTKQIHHVAWMSIALTIGLFVKPVLYPYAFLHCIIILLFSLQLRQKLLSTFIVSIIPICAILLYNTWNYQRTGKFHFSSAQSFNALFYHYTYFSEKQGADSAIRFINNERKKMEALPEFKDRYDHANKRGMQLLRENFTSYTPFLIKKSLSMLITPGKGEMDLFTGRLTLSQLYNPVQKPGLAASVRQGGLKTLSNSLQNNPTSPIAVLVLLFNLLRITGFICFIVYAADRKIKLFTAFFVSYFILLAGPIATTRYLLPVSLILIGCACLGFQEILQRRSKSINITV